MKAKSFELVRYDADEGKVFDWAKPHFLEEVDENGNIVNEIEEHLNVTTLFIGGNDDITNYVEVDADGNRIPLEPVEATENDYIAALAEMGVE